MDQTTIKMAQSLIDISLYFLIKNARFCPLVCDKVKGYNALMPHIL